MPLLKKVRVHYLTVQGMRIDRLNYVLGQSNYWCEAGLLRTESESVTIYENIVLSRYKGTIALY